MYFHLCPFSFYPVAPVKPGVNRQKISKITPQRPSFKFDKNFNSVLKFYENKVEFVQYVKVRPGTKFVKGSLEYVVCDNHQCLPPKDIDFDINL
ncbi:MAG: hypothetical protein EPN37_13235 [Chitinophagaceae bacterium]|nr:MAG: hypothetical protein EPN37_13235 [Chitinophagaceae bacterium]